MSNLAPIDTKHLSPVWLTHWLSTCVNSLYWDLLVPSTVPCSVLKEAVPQECQCHRTLSPAAKNWGRHLPAHSGSSEGTLVCGHINTHVAFQFEWFQQKQLNPKPKSFMLTMQWKIYWIKFCFANRAPHYIHLYNNSFQWGNVYSKTGQKTALTAQSLNITQEIFVLKSPEFGVWRYGKIVDWGQKKTYMA